MRRVILPLVLLASLAAAAYERPQLKQVGLIDLPGRPGFDQLTFVNNNFLLIAHQATNAVEIFDMKKRRVVAQVTNLDGPRAVVANPKKNEIYIGNAGGESVTIVSMADWKVLETVQLNAAPYSLTVSTDGERLYSANWHDRSITMMDLSPAHRLKRLDLDGTPFQVFYDAPSNLVYATLQDRSEVIAVDPSLRVVKRFRLNASQPTGVVLDPSGQTMYVAVRFAVLKLDANTGMELARVAAPAGVDAMWLDAYSGTLYAAASNTITIVHTMGGAMRAEDDVHTEVRGHTIAFDPLNGYIYMPGGKEGQSKLLILKKLPASEPAQNAQDTSGAQQVAEKK